MTRLFEERDFSPQSAPLSCSFDPRIEGSAVDLPRLLVVTPIYPWPGNPSEGIFVHRQVRNLVRLGHRVQVLVYHPAIRGLHKNFAHLSWMRYHPRWLTWPREQDGVPVKHLFYAQPRRRGADAVPAIVDAISAFIDQNAEFRNTDIVYAHWLWTAGAVALRMRERFGWPVAAIARGSDLHRWQSVHPHCRTHVTKVLESVDLPLANCGYLLDRAIELVPAVRSRVRIARNGCDHRLFSPPADRKQVRDELGLTTHNKYFLCCASVAEHKGLRDLAEAWHQFASMYPEWRLVVIGPTMERRVARSFVQRAGSRAELRGRVAAHRVVDFLRAADAYVQPSRLEGLANATMEAMAVGLPVVATQAGGQGELIHHGINGWLVPTEQPRALLKAMLEVAQDPIQATVRGQKARESIIIDYNSLTEVSKLSGMLCELFHRKNDVRALAV